MSTRLISDIPLASCYCYSPRGISDESRTSRKLCGLLKSGDLSGIQKMVNRVRRLRNEGMFGEFFTDDTVLVPVPGSAPIRNNSTPWIGERICDALATAGLGREVLPIAKRVTTVPKSAYQARGERPTPMDHFESIHVQREIVAPDRLLLVDEEVTKGSTLLGLASRVQDVYPDAEIRAFAMIRTMGLQNEIESMYASSDTGRIELRRGNDANRVD